MGSSASKPEPPRTFWQYLKGPMHTFELKIDAGIVTHTEHQPGGGVTEQRATVSEFIGGALHDVIRASMNADVLPAAVESAQLLAKGSCA